MEFLEMMDNVYHNLKRMGKEKMKQRKANKKAGFSKSLLIQESLLIWVITIAAIVLAFICVLRQSYAELPWLSAMVGFPWAAYGVSQAFYY